MEIFIKCLNFTITSKMRTKSFALMFAGMFIIAFALGLAGATAEFVDNTLGIPITTLNYGNVNQGQSATVSFKICDGNGISCTDVNTDALANLVFNTPITFTSGSNTFTSNAVVGTVSTLTDDTTSNTMSLTITVPSDKKGIFTGTLILSGDEPSGTSFTTNPSLVLSVDVKDVTAPAITITGSNPAYVLIGQAYTDAGATALDATDGTVVASTLSNNVNVLTEGVYSIVYTAQDSSGNVATATRAVIVTNSFCPVSSNSTSLDLNVDIANKGQGDDGAWQPLDIIEIEVEFNNNRASSNGAYDLNDLTFELGIFDSTGKNVAGDMIWISEDSEKFEFGDVDEGDDAKHTFILKVNPEEELDGDFELKIKAYPAGDESTTCISDSSDLTSFGASKYFASISIDLASDENAVVVDEENLPLPALAQCGQAVTFSANVWNVGKKDFEDQIMITLFNSELGISENKTITGDFDQGEMTQVTFKFDVPVGMEEKIYNLDMRTYYDWDADKSKYDEVSEETFNFPLTISGKCVPPQLTISASLESGGKAGEKLVVKSTITNTGTEQESYTFAVSEYSDWASDAKINNTLTLAAGQSGDIWITLDVAKKVSGDKTFNIQASSSDGELLKTQPVQVGIEGRQGLNLSDSDSLVAILIALISAIVIAIIIVLIVKASKK